ncbi:MAG TPA: septum formation initiator family protein [Rhizomicrobium sp.]|jgi:cell division protein FtsB|nr:septum formation initiator family protein [Rhizomicrobium sp.]
MRIKRSSINRVFALSVLPAITCAVVAYFGYYAVWGERGMIALSDTQARLEVQTQKLAQARDARHRLEHNIELMNPDHPDPDMVRELAHNELMIGGRDEVAVSRGAH